MRGSVVCVEGRDDLKSGKKNRVRAYLLVLGNSVWTAVSSGLKTKCMLYSHLHF